jgi:hypothetical protein
VNREAVPRISAWGVSPDPGASNTYAKSEEEITGCAAARPVCCGSDALFRLHAELRALTRSSELRVLLRREIWARPVGGPESPQHLGKFRTAGRCARARTRVFAADARRRVAVRRASRGASGARVPRASRRDMLSVSIRVGDRSEMCRAGCANGSNRLSRAGGRRLPARGVCGDTRCATYA